MSKLINGPYHQMGRDIMKEVAETKDALDPVMNEPKATDEGFVPPEFTPEEIMEAMEAYGVGKEKAIEKLTEMLRDEYLDPAQDDIYEQRYRSFKKGLGEAGKRDLTKEK